MLTMLLYVLIVGLVAALLFLVASAIFGRSEELGPLPEGTTVTVLPAAGISGCDVRALRFQQVFRGYKAGEVDWALTRLAARIDELEGQLAQATAGTAQSATAAAPTALATTGTQPAPAQSGTAPNPEAGVGGPLAGVVAQASPNGAAQHPQLTPLGTGDTPQPRRVGTDGDAPIPQVLPGESAAPAESGDEPGAR
ncbi:DivIVA domain-containing protein [Nocardia sp. CDC153]|uniref:DivIVA domain-containing protein n=1 Tax=Nocardia sp. CDC153 TaxID=3112167 RepID=UPI003FA37A4A